MNLHPVDLCVIAAYMIGVALIGAYCSRKNQTTDEYFLGGRSFSGWIIGLSMVGAAISSITFLSMPADAYKSTWMLFIPYLMMPVCALLAAYFIVPKFRRAEITSAYEFLESRFGPSIRVYGGCAYIVTQILRLSLVHYLLALLMHETTGLDVLTCIIAGGVFVGIYTMMGGIDAVIWTDVIQTTVLMLGSIICLGVIIDAMPGGLDQIFAIANEHHKLSLGTIVDGKLYPPNWSIDFSTKTTSMLIVTGVVFFLTEYVTAQHMIQRYCAARSLAEARKGLLYAVIVAMPTWAFYMFLGTSLFAFYQYFPTAESTAMLNGVKKAEQIVPYFIINNLPIGLVGIVISAALAAGMSSLDASINAVSTVGMVDIYRRHIAKNRDDKHYLRVAKTVSGIASLFMILGAIALLELDTHTLQSTIITLTSLAGGGLLGLFLLGLLTDKGDARSVWVGIAFTLIFTLWTILQQKGLLPERFSVPFDLYYTSFFANVLMFVTGYGLTLFWPLKKAGSPVEQYSA